MVKKRGIQNIVIHKSPISKLYDRFKTSERGLLDKSIPALQEKYGLNCLSEKKQKTEIIKFLLQFKNFFSILLLIGSGLSFISDYIVPGEGSNYIGWVLLGVTILNAAFTYIQERKAEIAMKSFKNLISTSIAVIRNGKELELDAEQLVPGDIIILREGDKIPADARIIECYNLKVDHSALTGESEPQLRSLKSTDDNPVKSRNMVFSGTLVQNGSGKALVVATGDTTQIGKIASMTEEVEGKMSHMQKELAHFIKIISVIAIILGILFFLAGFFLQYHQTGMIKTALLLNLVFAIGIIVANVPEGLLPTVTLTLSIAAQKMAKSKALVKNVDAIETLGSLTVICSDKTGTLTENKLQVHGFYLNNNFYDFHHQNGSILLKGKEQHIHTIKGAQHMKDVLLGCNNSNYDVKTESSSGDPTEICLKKFIAQFSNINYIEKEMPRKYEIPFESGKKYMITAHQMGSKKVAFLKGAPEVILKKCLYQSSERKKSKLTKKKIQQLLKINEKYSSQGYRVLAFATKDISQIITEKNLEKDDYVFYGFVIMQDPPRQEVPLAVEDCHNAGIKIIVISGDQGNTVESIAKQVGIVKDKARIVLSEELKKMSDDELKEVLKEKELIFARSLPEDKLRIVKNLQEIGEIVAVTGDGVNDAPALKRADVGVAMGECGTEVAKEAADIVLLDDNFATISKAIKYGRTVYDNIQSFIMYILTSNIPEIMPYLLFVVFAPIAWPLALPVLLILAIDLGTDMVPAIGLGVEKPSADIMKRKPRARHEKLCNTRMVLRSYGFFGPLQTLFSFLIFFHILFSGGWRFGQNIAMSDPLYQSAVTGFLATIIITQMFNLFACRHAKLSLVKAGIFTNRIIILGILTEIILLLMLIVVEPISKIFGTHAFPLIYIPWMIGAGAVLLILEEIRKYLERNHGLFKIR